MQRLDSLEAQAPATGPMSAFYVINVQLCSSPLVLCPPTCRTPAPMPKLIVSPTSTFAVTYTCAKSVQCCLHVHISRSDHCIPDN